MRLTLQGSVTFSVSAEGNTPSPWSLTFYQRPNPITATFTEEWKWPSQFACWYVHCLTVWSTSSFGDNLEMIFIRSWLSQWLLKQIHHVSFTKSPQQYTKIVSVQLSAVFPQVKCSLSSCLGMKALFEIWSRSWVKVILIDQISHVEVWVVSLRTPAGCLCVGKEQSAAGSL